MSKPAAGRHAAVTAPDTLRAMERRQAVERPTRDHSELAAQHGDRSHVDRLVDLVRHSSLPAPAIYALTALAFLAVEVAVKLLDGTFPDGFRLIHVVLPIYAVAILPAADVFERIGARSISTSRPLLTLSDEDIGRYRRRMLTMPAAPALGAGVAGVVALAVLTVVQPPDTYAVLGTMTSSLTSAVEWMWLVLVWFGVGTATFLIVRQMATVWELTTRHIRVELFSLGPIYAFSRLTAAHAVFTAAVVIVASLALSRLAGTFQWAVFAGAALLLAGAAFVVPLWGARRLIAHEKRRREDELGRTIDTVASQLRDRADRAELAGMEDLKTALEGLVLARQQIRAVSAWPWRPETLRGVLSALLAPLVIWLVTRLLETYLPA
jgi:HAMP domain-containing protein